MAPIHRTAKHKLLDTIMATDFGTTLGAYVNARRAEGVSWRRIAAAVTVITGEDIADVTLIDWFDTTEPESDGGAAA